MLKERSNTLLKIAERLKSGATSSPVGKKMSETRKSGNICEGKRGIKGVDLFGIGLHDTCQSVRTTNGIR